MGSYLVAVELAKDPPPRAPAAGVDEDVPDEIGVDRVRQRDRIEVPDGVGELLHLGA